MPQVSPRDEVWFEEVTAAVARGAAALRRAVPDGVAGAALALEATAAAGTPADELLGVVADDNRSPDAADAARALVGLARSGFALKRVCLGTVHAALTALTQAQDRDGSWSACATATGAALEAVGLFGFRIGQRPVNAAVEWLLVRQEPSGCWADGPNGASIGTTRRVLAGLCAVGADVYGLPMRRAVRWLKESQNADGGWGDGSPAETADAVLALVQADEGESAEVRAGAEVLVGTQRADGSWPAGSGLPLLALARYAADRAKPEPRLVRRDRGHLLPGPKGQRHTLAEM